jgi:putative DNA primase/helicase
MDAAPPLEGCMKPPITDPAAALRATMRDAGLSTSDPIVPDGLLHRIHLEGDRAGSRNGWYVMYPDPPVSGAYGCWRRGISGVWSAAGPDRLTVAERAALRERAERARATRLVEAARRHEAAAGRAARLWQTAYAAEAAHPYLCRKAVPPRAARQRGDRLVLPIVDLDGRLWSLQFIGANGTKMLLSHGRKRGNVIPVAGAMPGATRVLLCEGWATGGTLADFEPDALVLAAVDAGNLKPVALELRRRWPAVEIVVCCDADPVGIDKGRAAAIAAGALVAVPEFPAGTEGSDYNDLAAALRHGRAA